MLNAGAPEPRLDRLVPELYHELKRLAVHAVGRRAHGATLQPTALVNEAYIRLRRAEGLDLSNRKQFLALAGRVMRQVLVDRARAALRQKRGGGAVTVTLGPDMAVHESPVLDLLALDEAMDRLATFDARQVRIIEMRYLAGLDVEEVAEILDLSPTTVKRETAMARAFLLTQLGVGRGDAPG